MVRATIDLTPDARLKVEPLVAENGGECAIGLVHARDAEGSAVVMGAPAQLRALAAALVIAAEQAEELGRLAELLAAAGMTERDEAA